MPRTNQNKSKKAKKIEPNKKKSLSTIKNKRNSKKNTTKNRTKKTNRDSSVKKTNVTINKSRRKQTKPKKNNSNNENNKNNEINKNNNNDKTNENNNNDKTNENNGVDKIIDIINRKKRRYRPGTVALREIRKYQKGHNLLIHRAPFIRLVRSIAQDVKSDVRFTAGSLYTLQDFTEQYITNLFRQSYKITIASKRTTFYPKDLQLAMYIMENK